MHNKGDLKTYMVVLLVAIAIGLVIILITGDTFEGAERFTVGCYGKPGFEYKCADEIREGQASCPRGGWTVDPSKKCEETEDNEEVECCYRAK
ncbi:MAG: hypothetical protein R6U32_07110 [Candidatus Woesearchaeota archaeon]